MIILSVTQQICMLSIRLYSHTSGKNHFHEMNGDLRMAGWK